MRNKISRFFHISNIESFIVPRLFVCAQWFSCNAIFWFCLVPGAWYPSIDDTLWKNVTFHIRSNVLVTFCRTTHFSSQFFFFAPLQFDEVFFPHFSFLFYPFIRIVLVNTNQNRFPLFILPTENCLCEQNSSGTKNYESIRWCQKNRKYFVHALPPLANSIQKLKEQLRANVGNIPEWKQNVRYEMEFIGSISLVFVMFFILSLRLEFFIARSEWSYCTRIMWKRTQKNRNVQKRKVMRMFPDESMPSARPHSYAEPIFHLKVVDKYTAIHTIRMWWYKL